MTNSRRGFLGCMTAVGAVAAMAPSPKRFVGPVIDPRQLSAEYFSAFLGQVFSISGDGFSTQSMELVSIEEHARAGRLPHHRDPFSLLFRTKASAQFTQRVCALENVGFGTTEALIVPVGTEGTEHLFEVVYG